MKVSWFGPVLLLTMSQPLPSQVPTGPGEATSPAAVSPNGSGNVQTIYQVGNTVKAPQLLNRVGPRYSKEARKDKISGVVEVGFYVDEKGFPRNVHISRGIGHGLDEEAVLTVRQYRFTPGTKDGVPVPVELLVKISFQMM